MSMTTLYLLIPISEAAKAWVSENVTVEPYSWLGPNIGVEHRFIEDIVSAMESDGLVRGTDFSVTG